MGERPPADRVDQLEHHLFAEADSALHRQCTAEDDAPVWKWPLALLIKSDQVVRPAQIGCQAVLINFACLRKGGTEEKRIPVVRSEERRVVKGCVSTGRSRWAPYHKKKKI